MIRYNIWKGKKMATPEGQPVTNETPIAAPISDDWTAEDDAALALAQSRVVDPDETMGSEDLGSGEQDSDTDNTPANDDAGEDLSDVEDGEDSNESLEDDDING